MAFTFTSDELVASIKVRARVPTSQGTFTEARIRKICDEEIAIGLVPKILAARENYFLKSYTISLTSGTAEYRIPTRAIGVKLKAVQIEDTSGNLSPLNLIAYEDRGLYVNSNPNLPVFYIQNSSVVLVPTPTTTAQYTLHLPYFIRPSTLVAVSAAAQISSIDPNTNSVVVSSIPSTITTSTPVDVIKADGGFECIAIDESVTVSGTTITFSALPTGLAVGDYIALAGETPIPQIPGELHTLLSLRATVTILESLGFVNEMKAAQAKLKEAEESANTLLTPRSDGNPKKLVNYNGPLRQRTRGFFY
jgi:hypothetical protein